MNLSEVRDLYDGLTPTRHPRTYIAKQLDPGHRTIWRHVMVDDDGDASARMYWFASKLEAMAGLPDAVRNYFGEEY